MTDERGPIKALLVLAAIVAMGAGAVSGIRSLLDQGPESQDIRVTTDILPDASVFGGRTHFLLPYGEDLPVPPHPAYCASAQTELARLGTTVGASLRVTLQNTYSGNKLAEVQVTGIRTQLVSSRPAQSGVIVQCANSGGDTPIVAELRAEDDALATDSSAAPPSQGWRFSDPSPAGPLVSFVLGSGEQQQVNLTINPGVDDQEILVLADMISEGRRFSVPLTSSPIWVPSDSAASKFLISVKGVFDESASHYYCWLAGDYSERSICPTDQVFTKAEEEETLAELRPQQK